MKVKKTKYDIFVEIVCLTLLIGVSIYLYLNWSTIPDKIPGHYNAMGQIDRMGSKGELLILPIIGWLIYLFLTVIEKFPQIWNTGVTVTEENKERVYRITKNLLNTVKLITVAVFVYLTINSSQAISLSVWFLPIFLILEFGSMIFFIIKLVRAK
ncbi:DUF1648 domain-containing protein [[Clostridium] fimetarium]|uniref:DUF1648 domain-containing protein n=1 Tax=[Clostridium] fimetarium TaxID=99656 RepID=A0A1I0RSX6_9FIRM|nr:DUF1648 domain-containing protein [[Clostridium] fimetarium]SEW44346.1 Protein of unknown function [[Clostridium] fimetarium]